MESEQQPDEASREDATQQRGRTAPPPGWYRKPGDGPGGPRRWWDGAEWTDHYQDADDAPRSEPSSRRDPYERPDRETARRRGALRAAIRQELRKGDNRRVEEQSEYHAIIVAQSRTNHVIHAILSILTCGLWLVVWLVVAWADATQRYLIEVDAEGRVSQRKLK